MRKRTAASWFVEGAASLGVLAGVLEAVTTHPQTVCTHGAAQQANSRLGDCIDRSITAIVVHYTVPMVVGCVAGAVLAIALVLSLRAMRARA